MNFVTNSGEGGGVWKKPTKKPPPKPGGVYHLFQAAFYSGQLAKVFVLWKYGFSP